jgi:cytochrome c biogenesis protein CcmG/thiol:disulfide interchange protein DsbE
MLLKTVALAALLLLQNNKPAPGFTLKDAQGREVSLASYKGKVVLLNFWATWCVGCKQEIPWFMDFQTKYKADGLEVLGVSLDDEGWKVLKPYLAEHPMNYTVVLGNDDISALYGGIDALPATLLIDRQGNIAYSHNGVVDRTECDKELQALLAPKALPAQMAFDVASIRLAPAQPLDTRYISRNREDTRLIYNGVSVLDLIAEAYHVQHRQISGPDWLSTQIFDITATYPKDSGEKAIPEMLKTLLAQRFGVKLHEESKEMPLYAITSAKTGVKMKKAEADLGKFNVKAGKTVAHIEAANTVAQLADQLSGMLDRPVVDQSGLEGDWVIDLQWTLDSSDAPGADSVAPSIFTAMQEQLGLRLAPAKGPVRQLIVDHAEKTPTDN